MVVSPAMGTVVSCRKRLGRAAIADCNCWRRAPSLEDRERRLARYLGQRLRARTHEGVGSGREQGGADGEGVIFICAGLLHLARLLAGLELGSRGRGMRGRRQREAAHGLRCCHGLRLGEEGAVQLRAQVAGGAGGPIQLRKSRFWVSCLEIRC